jgi:hypothetical protein
MKKLSKEDINKRIEDRNIFMSGEYIGSRIKTEFHCSHGHSWMATPDNIIRGGGCPHCIKSSKEEVNRRIGGRGIRMTGEYTNRRTKTEFECINNHKWLATPNAVKGCPYCATRDSSGFNPHRPSWIYIIRFDSYIKYGISNNIEQRLNKHKQNGAFVVTMTKLFEDGSTALRWERAVKESFGGKFVSKEVMPDGYTETLCVTKLESLLETIPA